MRLQLKAVNSNVYSVHAPNGDHVGNLKRVGAVWKFKAIGYGPDGEVEPGGGALTDHHNAVFDAPDAQAVNLRLGPHL